MCETREVDGPLMKADYRPVVLELDQLEYEAKLEFVPVRRGTITLFLGESSFVLDDTAHNLVGNKHMSYSHVCYECGDLRFKLREGHGYEGPLQVSYEYRPVK